MGDLLYSAAPGELRANYANIRCLPGKCRGDASNGKSGRSWRVSHCELGPVRRGHWSSLSATGRRLNGRWHAHDRLRSGRRCEGHIWAGGTILGFIAAKGDARRAPEPPPVC